MDIEVHNGLNQSGNTRLTPRVATDWFIAQEGAALKEVGAEDFIILDQLPPLQKILSATGEDHQHIQEALDKLFSDHASKSDARHYSIPVTAQPDASEPLLSIDIQSPGQPFSVYYGGELYTIPSGS